jgi:outer membrane protein insertion porin family
VRRSERDGRAGGRVPSAGAQSCRARLRPGFFGRGKTALLRGWLLAVFALTVLQPTGRADGPPSKAELRVRGLGWWDNRKTEKTLALLAPAPGPTLDASAIEDAALILFSQLTDQGYLTPEMQAELRLPDGRTATFPLDARLEHPLPRPLEAARVTLRVKPGRRYTLREVTFDGLQALREDDARAFFVGEALLIPLGSERIYSPARLRRSIGNLQAELEQRGYANAAVSVKRLETDPATGDTRVRVKVDQGPLWHVRTLQFEIADGSPAPAELAGERIDWPWSPVWRQDTTTAIRRWYFARGHPDVQVRLQPEAAPEANGRREVTVTVLVHPGPEVHVGQVRFTGLEDTREPPLRRLVRAHRGDLLDPAQFDDAQARLARLGVFRGIDLDYTPKDGAVRDATFRVTEGRRQEVNLLAGYGSYEQFRGGMEWRHFNLFGLAHTSDLLLVQSMKSTRGSYTYTVPELFGTSVDGTARVFGLRREELSFVREEYGTTVSLLWPLRKPGLNLTTSYTYQSLHNVNNTLATQLIDTGHTTAASIDVNLVRDRRDNPLNPRHGYKVSLEVDEASTVFGGEVDYQRAIFDASWHTSWGRGRWLHVGFAHGVITTLGGVAGAAPPVNILFYPGGDSSIRGYTKGEAAPRADNGQFVGAKTYVQANLELEQALTPKWSVVAFADGLGTATRLADYPYAEKLFSAGLGVRYHTIIGPIRLEYGHNLNPRPFDPSGTVLLSVGFPF